MNDDLIVNHVRSVTSGVFGRSLNSARSNHFVIDEPAHRGGPGEAMAPSEAFLAGIAACGVLIVEAQAAATGVALRSVEAGLDAVRRRETPNRFESITIRFQLGGDLTTNEAEELVRAYQGK